MSDSVPPRPVIPLDEENEPIQPRVPVPWWRWALAALLAPVIFMLMQLPIAFCLGQTFNEIPRRWGFIPLVGEIAIGVAVTIWALRDVVRPQPRKQRGFPVLRDQHKP